MLYRLKNYLFLWWNLLQAVFQVMKIQTKSQKITFFADIFLWRYHYFTQITIAPFILHYSRHVANKPATTFYAQIIALSARGAFQAIVL
jgi:hypothetical protein